MRVVGEKLGELDAGGCRVHARYVKITLDLSDSELKEILLVTGEKKKGPAIRKLVRDALRLKRREAGGREA